MNRKVVALVLLLALVLAFLLTGRQGRVCFQDKCVRVEIADTPQKRETGLMHRERMDEDYGMLFVFPEEGNYPFWMKNTLIPLDIIWINSSKQVVHIEHATPCLEEPCAIYASPAPARFVLEVSGGFTVENNINAGDEVTF